MYVKIKDFNIYYEKIGTGKKEILILPGWGDTRITSIKKRVHNLYLRLPWLWYE